MSIEIRNNVGVTGEFSFKVLRADGTVKKRYKAQNNLILNGGLDRLNESPHTYHSTFSDCIFGVGIEEPSPSDTSLTSPVGSASNNRINYAVSWSEISPNMWRMRKPYRFDFDTAGSRGIAGYQLSEVGVQTSGSSPTLASKSLIKDSQGNPTTIQLLPEEILQVTYNVYFYFDTSQKEGSFTINEGEEDEAIYNFQANFMSMGVTSGAGDLPWAISLRPSSIDVNTQRELLPVTTNFAPSGTIFGGNLTPDPYVPGTFTRTYSATMPINQGNISGGIGWLRIFTNNMGMFQLRIARQGDDAPIPKTNEYRLDFESFFHVSINRYDGPVVIDLPPIDTPEEP